MSTLKNAANSPSSKSGGDSKSKSSLKESSRDKEKKVSSSLNVTSTKNKSSSSNKVKSLDLSGGDATSDGLPSPSGAGDVKTNSSQLRTNRKGSLSAIVDKLKVNAQHCDIPSSGNKDRTSSSSVSKLNESSKTGTKLGDAKNSEYMVKPSSDGMKITINKTRTKDNSSSSKPSSSSSSTVTNKG